MCEDGGLPFGRDVQVAGPGYRAELLADDLPEDRVGAPVVVDQPAAESQLRVEEHVLLGICFDFGKGHAFQGLKGGLRASSVEGNVRPGDVSCPLRRKEGY